MGEAGIAQSDIAKVLKSHRGRPAGDDGLHHIGVRVERKVEVLDVDQNYFVEDEQHQSSVSRSIHV